MTKQLGYPLGNWPVSFDPSVQMKPANRKLSVLELAAIWVYLEETQKRFLLNMSGEAQRRILRIFPKESEYVTAVIKRFKEIAFDERFHIFEDVQEL